MKNLLVSLSLTARDDGASRTVKRTMDGVGRSAREAQKASSRLLNDTQKMSQAREALNIRSEHSIQREIQKTEAAYSRLKNSGTASARELSRAYEAMQGKVSALNAEMGKTTRAQAALQKAGAVGRAAVGVGAGVMAGAYMLAQPVKRQMAYEKQLAITANDVYADENTAGRRQGMDELRSHMESLDKYGGDRSEMLNSYAELMGSGAFGEGKTASNSVMKVMEQIAKTQASADVSGDTLSKFVIAAKKQGGLKDGEESWAIDALLRQAKDGGMSPEELAQNIISQMPRAQNTGFTGKAGLNSLMSKGAVWAKQEGSGAAASERMNQMLEAITSPAIAEAVLKSSARVKDEKTGQMKPIDLTKTYADASMKGVDNLSAFSQVMQKVLESDKKFKEFQKQATAIKDPAERQKFIASQEAVVMKTVLGKTGLPKNIINSLLTEIFSSDQMKAQIERGLSATGETERDYDLAGNTNAAKIAAAQNAALSAEDRAVKPLSDAIGNAAGKLTDYAEKYPGLSTALTGATLALKALAAAALASGASSVLTGGAGGIGKSILGMGKSAIGAIGSGATAVAGSSLAIGAAGVAAAGAGGYGIGTLINDNLIDGTALGDKIGESVARVLAFFGNEDAKQAIQLNVTLDGEQIASTVERRGEAAARRY